MKDLDLNTRFLPPSNQQSFLIFFYESVLTVQLVVLDVEFNPESNDGIFKGNHLAKLGACTRILGFGHFQPVILADIRS